MKILGYENVTLDDFDFDNGGIQSIDIKCDVIIKSNKKTSRVTITCCNNEEEGYNIVKNEDSINEKKLFKHLANLEFYYNVCSELLEKLKDIKISIEETQDNKSYDPSDIDFQIKDVNFGVGFVCMGKLSVKVILDVDILIKGTPTYLAKVIKDSGCYWSFENNNSPEYMYHDIRNSLEEKYKKDFVEDLINKFRLDGKKDPLVLDRFVLHPNANPWKDDLTTDEVLDFYGKVKQAFPPEKFIEGITGDDETDYLKLLKERDNK